MRQTQTHEQFDPASILPEESQQRLTALAELYLRETLGAESVGRFRASVVALPMTSIAEPRAWRSSAERQAIALPSEFRDDEALAIVAVKDTGGLTLEHHDDELTGLALCVSSRAPRDWSAADLAALSAIATTAGLEVQLRSELAMQLSVAEKLRISPLHDPVTELANRELFLDRITQALMRCARQPERNLAVMSLSLSQFQKIEDGVGYEVAQEVLKEVAGRLRVAVRNVDSLARLSGDEFGILLESLRDDSDAARVAGRIHDALRQPIRTRWDEFVVSARIGVVLSATGLDSPSRMLQLAGLARARADAADTPYELFDPVMQQKAQARLQGEMELRRGIDQDELMLYYQPIVSLSSGDVTRLEALVRWQHPRKGVVGAGDFIALAEETGLVVPLGWKVLEQACSQLNEWRASGIAQSIPVSVNMTASNLVKDLFERTRTALGRHTLPGTSLSFELTEGLLVQDPASARKVIDELRELGVGVHIDDFGTGYSSLQYLHELPVDAIKIDRRFVARMGDGSREGQVAVTIRELARQIGVPVVAEGVETVEQLERVRALGCEFAQGFLFSEPLPADEIPAFLSSARRW
jgi:diguanylate cyclase (GGDEF)-like protein